MGYGARLDPRLMVQMRDVELLARRMRQQLVVLLQDLVEALAMQFNYVSPAYDAALPGYVKGVWMDEPTRDIGGPARQGHYVCCRCTGCMKLWM